MTNEEHHTRELEKLAFGRVFGGEAITGKSNDELRSIIYDRGRLRGG